MSTQNLPAATALDDSTKKSIDLLSRIIKNNKPPLTAKLLAKPPFRYLHDVISEVIRVSGYASGLYSEVEMNSENVKDKDAKLAYLTKLMDVVGMSTGVFVRMQPAKVIAGLEPEETNAFLQLFAKAVLKKVDTTEVVKRVLAGEHQQPKKAAPAAGEKATAPAKEAAAKASVKEAPKAAQKPA
ncbi:TRAF3-interacting protein 1, partial [Rhizophlyctis rosea]